MPSTLRADDADLARLIPTIAVVAFDFDGVFTDNMVYVFQDGREAVRCSRGDGMGLELLRATGVQTVIISKEQNPVVTARANKLKIRCVQGCEDKCAALESFAAEIGVGLDRTAFVGNDVNDIPLLSRVGLPIVVRDAHPDVLPVAKYRTRARGGNGAIREICDLFVKVRLKPDATPDGSVRL